MSERLSAAMPAPLTLRAPGRGLRRLVDAALLDAMARVLRGADRGRLLVTLPSGRCGVLGHGDGAEAAITFRSYALLSKAMRRGLLGFADAFVSGDIDCPDLYELFRFFVDNEAAITAGLPHLTRGAPRDVNYHASRSNTRKGSRRNIAAHYDLGNEFYRLWLDAGMSYSSAIYSRHDMTLDEAQATKHARIVEALDLSPGHDVLEIGCGWGALAEEIAARAASVTAITISRQQLDHARRRLAASRYADRCTVAFQDYRDTRGRYDRIACIEMIEAVGEDNWPAFFRAIDDRLVPGGVAVVQAITIREDLYADYRSKPDFIQRYIFPGGMLPSVAMMRDHAGRAGLELVEIERFGESYALTLAEWRRRFVEAWPRIEAQGFDERFRRMWIYYLTYCEIGFRYGTIDVGLYSLRKA